MRLLYVSVVYPLPPNNGSKMRILSILRAIANAGHDVTLVAFAEPEEIGGTDQELAGVCKESDIIPRRMVSLSQGKNYTGRLRALFAPTPFTLNRFRSEAVRARITERLRSGKFDAVICDNVYSAINLPATDVPVVMNSQNVEYVILERFVEQEGNSPKSWYAWLEASKLRRFEAAMYQRATLALTCSCVDAELVRKLCPSLPVAVVPNVVDVSEYDVHAEEDDQTIIYQGGMDWFPNRDALEYFVRDILPLVQKEISGVRLIAAGRSPVPEFRARFQDVPALEFTGTLPDLKPVIARATVSVVPLRIGSGTRLKILEGGAMGKAMVSSSIGVEGLDFANGKEILIADEPAQFARHVVALLRDPAQRRRLGTAARKRVLADYDLRALERSVVAALSLLERAEDSGDFPLSTQATLQRG